MTITTSQIAPEATTSPWHDFKIGLWQKELNVRDFIQQNYEPYQGDESFLAPATERTTRLWDQLNKLFLEERKKGVLDISRSDCWPSDRSAIEAGDHAERRPSDGSKLPKGLWVRARPPRCRDLFEVPQDTQ